MSFVDTPAHTAAAQQQQQQQYKTPSHLTPIPKSDDIPPPSTAATTQQLPTPHNSKQSTPDPSSDSTRMSTTTGAPPAFTTPIRPEDVQHIWVVAGPAGCGKSTVGRYLATQCSIPYLEGDDFHPPSNKEKMSNGIPLTDADRWDWLITLREESIKSLTTPSSTTSAHTTTSSSITDTSSSHQPHQHHPHHPRGIIITCSSLKRKYRDVLRIATYTHPAIHIHFLFLRATESMLQERVAARQNHYMKSDMVRSQFLNLEFPDPEVEGDVRMVDVGDRPEVVGEKALQVLRTVLRVYGQRIKEEEEESES